VINVETARIEAQFSYNLGNNQQVAFLLSGNQQNAPAVPSQPAAQTPAVPAPAAPVTYKVGDTGPAGGLIFYDKGNNSGGWRYLEAAPEETEQSVTWSNNSEQIGTGAAGIGVGKKNTETIINYQRNNGVLCMAAQVCDALVAGGFDDWFLPSRGELMLMYTNLRLQGIGGFKEAGYWSSSEVDRYSAYQQGLSSGNQRSWTKQEAMIVRACRQF
jgi:hypothetical protein